MQREGKEPGYLGAMLDSERRLVLVPLDPARPWAAFRRMRAWMKRRKTATRPSMGVFTAPPQDRARVINLPTRWSGDRH